MMSRTLIGLALLGVAATARGATEGAKLYAPCVVCHQPNGWGSEDGAIPNLAGQQRRYLEAQLKLYASGARVDPAMQVVTAHPKSPEPRKFADVAAYLSTLAWNPTPSSGSGQHLRVGQEIYTHICAACHGADGRGQPSTRVPRIAGQHYLYLRAQIEEAAHLHRDLAPPEMTSALRGMRQSEKEAVADYVSRLGNSEPLTDQEKPHRP